MVLFVQVLNCSVVSGGVVLARRLLKGEIVFRRWIDLCSMLASERWSIN